MVKAHTETAPLLNPKHAGEDLLPLQGTVHALTRREAVVAGSAFGERFTASTLVGLPEVLKELDSAALGAFAKLDELREVIASNLLLLLVRDTIDEAVQSSGIGPTVEQHTFTRQAVASRPTRFLVVTLDVLGQIMVDDESHVGLVDAHAEGNGGDDDRESDP